MDEIKTLRKPAAAAEAAHPMTPRRLCGTRAMKNARFLHEVAPELFAGGEPLEGYGGVVPLEVLMRLHREDVLERSDLTPQLRKILKKGRPLAPRSLVRDPLFTGTLHFLQIFYIVNAGTTHPSVSFVSSVDTATAVQYAALASPAISAYARQYGANSLAVAPNVLQASMVLPDTRYNDAMLQKAVNDAVTAAGLPVDSTCVIVLNPLGVTNTDGDILKGIGGYHSKANVPYCFCNLFGANLTVADTADHFAMVLSHEIAEMTVDPNVDGGNPEVCDACGPNCQWVWRDFFGGPGNTYLESTRPFPPKFAYNFFINGIVQPFASSSCPAPEDACNYAPSAWLHLSQIAGHPLQADFDSSSLPNAARSVHYGDVDGDGRAEIVLQIDAAGSGGNDFWVMKFDPVTGAWWHLSQIPGHPLQADFDCSGLPQAARAVGVADVDGDGRAEVVVQIAAAGSGGNDFWVMKFDPAAGAWGHLSPIPGHPLQADFDCSGLPQGGRSVTVADVDGDGRAEVVVQIDAAGSGSNDFWVMKFDSAARAWRHLSQIPGHPLQADFDCSGLQNAARSVRCGDVDGDGRAEVVVQIDAAGSGANDFWVMKFDPLAGAWGHLSQIAGHPLQADFDCSGLPQGARSVALGDVDGDGRSEVIVQIDAAGSGGNDFWVMKFDPATAGWRHLSQIAGHPLQADFDCSGLPQGGRSVTVADVDGDGRAEVVVQIDAGGSGANDFWVMKFEPLAGNWRHLSQIPGHPLEADFDCSGLPQGGRSVNLADVDGDGRAEVVVQIDAGGSGGNDFWVMDWRSLI